MPPSVALSVRWRLVAYASQALVIALATPALALDPEREMTQYLRRSWSLVEGLPSTAIASLAQDANGDLWLATGEGLVRFDGFEFQVLDRGNTPAMGFSEVRAVALAGDGAVWAAVAFSGAMRCQARQCTAVGPPGRDFAGLQVAPDGVVWAFGDGVWRFADDRPVAFPELDAAVPNSSSLAFDANGQLWIGGDEGQVVLADPRAGRVLRSAEVPAPRRRVQVRVEAGGELRLETATDYWRCPADDLGACQLLLRGRQLSTGLRDRLGTLWVGSQGGDGLYRVTAKGVAQLTGDHLVGRRVYGLLEDREGNLWVATWDGGLMQLADAPFATWGKPEGLPVDTIRVVQEDAVGTLWAGSELGLIERQPGSWRLWPSPPGPTGAPAWVLSLAARSSGELLVGTTAGLYRRGERGLQPVPLGQGTGGLVYGLHAELDGTAWAGPGTELWRLDVDGGQTRLPVTDAVYDLARDRQGRLWVATRSGALRESDDGGLEPFTLPSPLARDILFTVEVDSRGNVWFGGLDRGLTRVSPDGTARTLTTRDGLINDSVHAVLEDQSGAIWVSSSKGIYRFDPDDVDRYLAGGLPRLPTRVFDESDGLRTRSTSGGSQPAGWRASDGRLWFATLRGLAVVDPRRLGNTDPPPARMTGVAVDGLERDPSQPIELAAGRHRLVIRWSASHLRAPEKLRFRYRLEGIDRDWIEVGGQRLAELPAAPVGTYRVAVAASLDGVSWGTPAATAVRVAPFPWQRAWFWPLTFAVTVLAVALVFRWRLARAANRELAHRQELESMVAFGREVTGLLDPEAIGRRLRAAAEQRWGPGPTLLLARREGREPLAFGSQADALPAAFIERLLAASTTLEHPLLTGTTTPLARDLASLGLAAVAPIASSGTRVGLFAVGPRPDGRPFTPRDLAHLSGLAAHAAAALEGAWQAQEAMRWRDLSEARREWSELDLVGRLVFAAVTRGGFDGPMTAAAVTSLLTASTEGEIRLDEGVVARTIERLCATGALERSHDGDGLRVERLRWLLLPEIRQPLAELARGASRTVGAYRLLERIGAGGMAEVFRAVNVHDGSPAAIKLLRPDDARDSEARRRLAREGELVAAIAHPNLVRLLARGEHEGRLYLAMELLAGETLAQRLQRGPLPWELVLATGRAVASALAELHVRGVIHRDVKPANIMIEPDGRCVLLDLGLARGLGASTLTQAESVLGTLRYMSPEALRGEPLTPASDLWSLGVTLHELATGTLPWPGADTLQVALELTRAQDAPALALPAATPRALQRALGRLLEPQLDRRLSQAVELVALLQTAELTAA